MDGMRRRLVNLHTAIGCLRDTLGNMVFNAALTRVMGA
jgi:hypothetical protein